MVGPQSGAIVAVEVFVELKIVAPVRVLVRFIRTAVDRPTPILASQEDAGQATRELFCDLIEIHLPAGTRRTLHDEVVAVVGVVLQQCANNERVHRHPNGPAPVRVATEHARVRFPWQIRYAIFLLPNAENKGMFGMITR